MTCSTTFGPAALGGAPPLALIRPIVLAASFGLVLAAGTHASAEDYKPARSKAANYLVREEIAEACEGKQGKIDRAAVIERDLTGDGKSDLIISHHGIDCADRRRSIFCGAQACTIKIYVRRGALLELAEDTMGVEGIRRLGSGPIPTVHTFAHGGKPVTWKWNGRAFGRTANAPAESAPGHSAASAAAPSPAAANPASSPGVDALDSFLGRLLPECEGSPEFNRFRDTLIARYGFNADGSRKNPRRQVSLPESIRPLMGKAAARNKGEYTQVLVPLRGSFRSLSVAELEFSFGNENGINATALMFAEPLPRVRAVLGSAVAEGARRLKAIEDKGEVGGAIEISSVRGRAALVCDLST